MKHNKTAILGFALLLFSEPVPGELSQSVETSSLPGNRDSFLEKFVRMSTRERIGIWRDSLLSKKLAPLQTDIENILIIQGVDSAPQIAGLVRNEKGYVRYRSLLLLSKMDRFVPASEIPLPQVANSVSSPVLTVKGLVSSRAVNGERIGKESYDVIQWAATQSDDHELQTQARESSGILENEWRHRPLDEVVQAWRDAVERSGGLRGQLSHPHEYALSKILGRILMEKVPDSLPAIIGLLQKDPSAPVRDEAVELLDGADSCRFRLRTTEIGRQAIQAARAAMARGGKGAFPRSAALRENYVEQLEKKFYSDEERLDPTSRWAIYALGMETFYGDATMQNFNRFVGWGEAKPEFRDFIGFLTRIDPYFPSWEYTLCSVSPSEEVGQPGFKARIERYHREWKAFHNSPPDTSVSKNVSSSETAASASGPSPE